MKIRIAAGALALFLVSVSQSSIAAEMLTYPTGHADMSLVMQVLMQRSSGCKELKQRKVLRSMTATAHCIYDGYIQALTNAGWPSIDLEEERVAVEFVVGEKIDKKQMTVAEAGLYEAKEYSRIDAEYDAKINALKQSAAQQQAADDQRATARAQSDASTQAAIAEAEAEVRIQQERLEEERLRAASQALSPPPAQQWPAWAPPPPSPPVNTECREYAGVVRCTTQ